MTRCMICVCKNASLCSLNVTLVSTYDLLLSPSERNNRDSRKIMAYVLSANQPVIIICAVKWLALLLKP